MKKRARVACSLVLVLSCSSPRPSPLPSPPPETPEASAAPAEPAASAAPPASAAPAASAPAVEDTPPAPRATPRLLAPWSTASVTSRRPVFRWALRAGSSRATLQLCRDAACAGVARSVEVEGEQASLTAPLEPGAWWWRVVDRGEKEATTTIWRFHISHSKASVASSWAPHLDMDGDGRVDLATSVERFDAEFGLRPGGQARPQDPVQIHLGRSGRVQGEAAAKLPGGGPVTLLGDVDGDGFCDLLAGGKVHLGKSGGFEATGLKVAKGFKLFAGGDIDGDGYADVVTGDGGEKVNVHLGGPGGLRRSPSATLSREKRSDSWPAGGALIDLDADGFADLVSIDERAIVLHRGGKAGLGDRSEIFFLNEGAEAIVGLDAVGDIDGDGYPDFTATQGPQSASTAAVLFFQGGTRARAPRRLASSKAVSLSGKAQGAGDVDGDGYDDLLLEGGPFAPVFLLRGGPSGPGVASRKALKYPEGQVLGVGDQAGDTDGDGFSDVLLSLHTPIDGATWPMLYLGGRGGLRQAPGK